MAVISKLASQRSVYSLYTYRPYDDESFFNKINSLFCSKEKPSLAYNNILEEIKYLYTDELVFNLKTKRNYDYICPVISNTKFYKLNIALSEDLSKALDVPVLYDLFLTPSMNKVDYKDMYTKDSSVEIMIDKSYCEKDILFIDIMCSTGVVLDYIATKFNKNSVIDFITIGVRFNADHVDNSKVMSIKELDFDLNCMKTDGYVVKIHGLFNKKDVIVDLRKNLSIVIGVNGDGKTTSYKIAALAVSDYIGDILQLAKYYFDYIELERYENERIIDTKIIKYTDVIIDKNLIIEHFSTEESKRNTINDIRSLLTRWLEEIYDSENAQFLTDEKNRNPFVTFLKSISDEEYLNIFKKLMHSDNTYHNDVMRLIRKYKLDVCFDDIIKMFTTIIKHRFLYDFNMINNSSQIYFDCTINRKLNHNLYKREMFFDDEGYAFENYYEDIYDIEPMHNENDYMDFIDEEFFDQYDGYEDYEDFSDDYISAYSDDYYDEYDGYNGLDVEPDDRADWEYEVNKRLEEIEDDCNEEYLWYKHKKDLIREQKERLIFSLSSLYSENLVRRYSIKTKKSDFENEIDINKLLLKFKSSLKELHRYIFDLQFDKKIIESVDNNLENEFNEYLLKNQMLIQFGLYSIIDRKEFEILSNAIMNKNMKNRLKFIDAFKTMVEATKSCISEKLIIVEKILNKYYVNKKVTVLNNTIYVLDENNNYIPLTSLSVGEKNLMIILLFMVFNRNNIIFDEPELSMNISWQYELIKDILRLKHHNQCITILTQTPQLIKYPILSSFITSIDEDSGSEYEYALNLGGSEDEAIEVELRNLGDHITQKDIELVQMIWWDGNNDDEEF